MPDNSLRLFRDNPWRSLFSTDSDETDAVESLTISELVEMYGEGAVVRGLAYMESLSTADQNYRASPDSDAYKKGYLNSMVDEPDDVDSDELENAVDKWQKQVEDRGLGLTD